MKLGTTLSWLAAALILALSGLALWFLPAMQTDGAQSREGGAQTVDVVATGQRSMPVVVRSVGSARAHERVTLTPEVSGRIEAVAFSEGDRVERGDLLVRLEAEEERAAVAEARARLERARKDLQRERQLPESEVVSQTRLDQLVAERDIAKAQLAAAKARLANHRLTAPFAGVVGLREVSPGALVSPETTIATLVDLDPIDIRFAVPGEQVGKLRPELMVQARTRAFPERRFTGRVDAVDAELDPDSRSVLVEARLANPDLALRPGMLLNVELVVERRRNAMVVPEAAIILRGDERYVFRVRDGHAERLSIRTGQRRDGMVEVLGGLDDGDEIVLRGLQKISDGAKVKPRRVSFDYQAPAHEPIRG